jgi:malate permease and related proteins
MDIVTVVDQVLVLFILLVVGYVIRKLKLIDYVVTRGISSLLVNLTLPALVITAMQLDFSPSRLNESFLVIGISGACYGLSLLIGWAATALIRPAHGDRGVYRFSSVFANVGFIGYPVLDAIWGRESLFYVALCNIWFNVLLFTLGTRLVAAGKPKAEESKADRLGAFLNPGTIATVLGFLLFISSVKLPLVLGKPLELLGNATTPLAMMVTGSFLAQIKFSSIWTDARVYVFTAVRLIVIPVIVFLLLWLAGVRGMVLAVPVVLAAMPVGVNASIMADQFGGGSEKASQIVFISTLFSIVTVPLVWLVLR